MKVHRFVLTSLMT